jgi:hypothetical protein
MCKGVWFALPFLLGFLADKITGNIIPLSHLSDFLVNYNSIKSESAVLSFLTDDNLDVHKGVVCAVLSEQKRPLA